MRDGLADTRTPPSAALVHRGHRRLLRRDGPRWAEASLFLLRGGAAVGGENASGRLLLFG
jgi:hypothetical protein